MPAFVHGKNTRVYVNSYDLSSCLNMTGSAGECSVADVTAFQATGGDKSYLTGLVDARLSQEGFYAGGTAELDEAFQAIMQSTLTGTVNSIVTAWPYGDTAGNFGFGMVGVPTRYEIQNAVDDAVKVSTEFQSSRGYERPVSLRGLALATGAGTVPAVDMGAASTLGATGYVHVPSGTNSALQGTVTIESSSTQGGAYTAHGTVVLSGTVPSTPNLGGLGYGYIDIAPGVTINRWVRVNLIAWGTASIMAAIRR